MVIKRGQMFQYNFDLGVQSNLMMLPFKIFKACKALVQCSSKCMFLQRKYICILMTCAFM